jgi:hypothetical protein
MRMRRLLSNLFAESRLPQESWSDLFDVLERLPLPPDDKAGLDLVCATITQSFARQLKPAPSPGTGLSPIGPRIPDLQPKAYGRLIPFTNLCKLWEALVTPAAGGIGPAGPGGLTDWIDRLTMDSWFTHQKSTGVLDRCPLGKFIMWSTFDEQAFDSDPFHPRPATLVEQIAAMGLDSSILGLPPPFEDVIPPAPTPRACVLMTYDLPPPMAPHVPTVVEAYAGAGRAVNQYFDVCRTDVDVKKRVFPRTCPPTSVPDLAGRPEVVHPVVGGSHLLRALEIRELEF